MQSNGLDILVLLLPNHPSTHILFPNTSQHVVDQLRSRTSNLDNKSHE